MKIYDTAGNLRRVKLNPLWGTKQWHDLPGHVADLKSVYEHVPACPAAKAVGVVAVKAPGGTCNTFEQSLSCLGIWRLFTVFLRFSHALSALATELLGLVAVDSGILKGVHRNEAQRNIGVRLRNGH